MENKEEKTNVIKRYELLIEFCTSLSTNTLANQLHKRKIEFLCEQQEENLAVIRDENAYLNTITNILRISCDNLCANYYYNYELYHKSVDVTKKMILQMEEEVTSRIESLIQGFLTNVLNTSGLEYIWTRVNANRKELYAAVYHMFQNFEMNQKLERILYDFRLELDLQANQRICELVWKKVLLDENYEGTSPGCNSLEINIPKIKVLQVAGKENTSDGWMDYSQKLIDEFLPESKMRQKMIEYRKSKMIEKIQEDYSYQLNHKKEEFLTNVKTGLEELEKELEQYRTNSFKRVNGRNVGEIPQEILRLEQEVTKFKKGKEYKLRFYLSLEGELRTIVSNYAVSFPNLINQDSNGIAEQVVLRYLIPWQTEVSNLVTEKLANYKNQKSDAQIAYDWLQDFLEQNMNSFTQIPEIVSQIPDYEQIEFGDAKPIIEQEFLYMVVQMKSQIQEELQHISTKKELLFEDQIRMSVKAMNDIAYQKFFEHWSMTLKTNVRTMIEKKDFSAIPSNCNYESYLLGMQMYLNMDAVELESIKEVMEYHRTNMVCLPRYQFLKVSMMSDASCEDMIGQVVEQEITAYLKKLDKVQAETKEIWNHALSLYVNEYSDYVRTSWIKPVFDRIQYQLLEEYHNYVLDEQTRLHNNYMDFTRYLHVYGKIEPQILDFILGNEKSFPMNSIAYDHWADGSAVTTRDFRDLCRVTKERWLGLKMIAEK